MRKSFLWVMVLAGLFMGVPGCSMGGGFGTSLIEGGISLAISLILSLVTGSLTTPTA